MDEVGHCAPVRVRPLARPVAHEEAHRRRLEPLALTEVPQQLLGVELGPAVAVRRQEWAVRLELLGHERRPVVTIDLAGAREIQPGRVLDAELDEV